MAMFLVVLRQSGPEFDRSRPLEEQSRWSEHAAFMDALVDDGFIVLGGPLADDGRVAHAVEADSRAGRARDARARPVERDAPARRHRSSPGRSGSTRAGS